MRNWKDVRILVIGAARQGLALARYFSSQGARVVLNDQHNAEQLTDAYASMNKWDVEWVTGGHPTHLLDRVDLICPSGGIPLDLPILVEAVHRGLPFSNDSQIFMEAVPCQVIGITGSAGKTTTTTLVGRMAQAAIQSPRKVWIGGNIGLPLVEYLDVIQPNDMVVLELSSFQLELMTVSPQVSTILNITPNHLDRHATLAAYTAAKVRILKFQTANDTAILCRDDAGAYALTGQVRGRLLSFGLHQPANGSGTFLRGDSLWLTSRSGES
jgi:UDP-N-acetylmuramoylalanine--D-glutamate ligase